MLHKLIVRLGPRVVADLVGRLVDQRQLHVLAELVAFGHVGVVAQTRLVHEKLVEAEHLQDEVAEVDGGAVEDRADRMTDHVLYAGANVAGEADGCGELTVDNQLYGQAGVLRRMQSAADHEASVRLRLIGSKPPSQLHQFTLKVDDLLVRVQAIALPEIVLVVVEDDLLLHQVRLGHHRLLVVDRLVEVLFGQLVLRF